MDEETTCSSSIGKYSMKTQLHKNFQICKCSITNDFAQLWKDFTAVSLELCKSIYFERPMKGGDFGLNPPRSNSYANRQIQIHS